MKKIVLSFDDGRWDTFYNVLPILREYKIRATVNIISKFILHPEKFKLDNCKGVGAMTIEQLKQCVDYGIEVGCHGAWHDNTINGIVANIKDFMEMGIPTKDIGFASPHSVINKDNNERLVQLIKNGTIMYIRSGIQIRERGFIYSFLTFVESITHSKRLFYYLNKDSIIKVADKTLIPSVSIKRYTTNKQIEYFIKKMDDDTSVVFTLHSILKPCDEGRSGGHWYWDISKFEKLCSFLNSYDQCKVVTVKEILYV